MDSSSQLTIVYDMLYYVTFIVLSIKTISRPLPIIVLRYQQLSEGRDN